MRWVSSRGSCAARRGEFRGRKAVRWATAASIRTSDRKYREDSVAVWSERRKAARWPRCLVRNAVNCRRRPRQRALDKDAV